MWPRRSETAPRSSAKADDVAEGRELSDEPNEAARDEATASVDSTDESEASLHRASLVGDARLVELMLKANVSANETDEDGNTGLHNASLQGHADVVKLLLEANATVDAYDADGNTPLHNASLRGHAKAVEFLLMANAPVDVHDEDGNTPLHNASLRGHVEVVKLLLKANATVDASDESGETSLHRASLRGHAEIVELLLVANATVDASDKDGRTALHKASLYGHVRVVELLLKAHANVNAAAKLGETPLQGACSWHQCDVVRLLLMAGANLHAEDKDGLKALHHLMLSNAYKRVESVTLDTLQVLVTYGATWDAKCDEMFAVEKVWIEAPALARCMSLWAQELADGLPFTRVPIEAVKRGVKSTEAYIEDLEGSREIVLRRKICLVGPSCAGKTSFVKSITSQQPQLVHVDNRTIGIDHFPLRFEQPIAQLKAINIHEVTFWDFAGQDAYQVAHSLFFSPRTLFLVCVDLEAFTVAFLQATIMSNMEKQETQLMNEFIERTVMKWIRMIQARQPDAEFVFIVTKEDLLKENQVTEQLLKNALVEKLKEVEAATQEMRCKQNAMEPSLSERVSGTISAPNFVFVSCTSSNSVHTARTVVEDLIGKSDRSFRMPDTYTQALEAIVAMRSDAKSHDMTKRIDRVFVHVDDLPAQLKLEPDFCRIILQALHDLGDVLWYEDLGVELFQDRVILDPLLLIDFIRQVINHNYSGQTMPHADLKALPYWSGFTDIEQMKAMKQVLQKFHLVYSADEDHTMSWDSDLIVPAYWQTKTPAAWLFLGDILRINDSKSCEGEAVRLEWEYHFEFGLPPSLFDHLVVASVSPFFTFDAGPDWIVYEEKEIAACRIMVGRDVQSLHHTILIEAVVAQAADTTQAKALWSTFQHLVRAFVDVLRGNPGLNVSSFAWDNMQHKIGFKRLLQSNTNASPTCEKWMPPAETWAAIRQLMLDPMVRDE